MNTLKKTYRLIAVLTLVLFAGALVVPAGLAAASLSCDMEMSHAIPVCCIDADMNGHQEKKKESQDCEQQTFCEQAVGSSPSEIPAITQHSKLVIAAGFLKDLPTIEAEQDHPKLPADESVSPLRQPPIFLLNSSFLN